MTLTESVTGSLGAVEADPRDGAARELALVYARQIDDDPDLLGDLGPKLHAVLDSLGLTPKARASGTKGGQDGHATNPLDELRAARGRRAGLDGSAPLDAPTA